MELANWLKSRSYRQNRSLCYNCGQVSSRGRVTEATLDAGQTAEEHLWGALHASDAVDRLRRAQLGLEALESESEPDTRVLLLRQAYLAHLEMGELEQALESTETMHEVGPLRDIVLADRARVLWAMERIEPAIDAQRLAVRAAPASRRSFHLWSLATLQHFADDTDAALATLEKAEQWAERDGSLVRAHAAYVRLCAGRPTEDLSGILDALEHSPASEGYGAYLLGMIKYHIGDTREAAVHLRAFLTRNASVDAAKRLTLAEELSRARRALAEIESD